MMDSVEKYLLIEALREHGNNKTNAAQDPRHHARRPAQEAPSVRDLTRQTRLRLSIATNPSCPEREVFPARSERRTVISSGLARRDERAGPAFFARPLSRGLRRREKSDTFVGSKRCIASSATSEG